MGGQQTYNYHIAKRLHNKNHTVEIAYYLDGDLNDYFREASSNIHKLGEPPKSWAKAVKNPFHVLKRSYHLLKFIKTRDTDIIVSNGSYTYLIAGIAKLFSKVKHARLLGREPSKEKFLWKFFNVLRMDKMTDLYLSFSLGNKELRTKGVDPKKLADIGYGVDTEMFKPNLTMDKRNEERKKLGVKRDELLIAWIGRIYEHPGELRYSLGMAKKIKKEGFNKFKFLVIGEGDWMDGMKKMVKDYNLEDHMIYKGWQLPEQIPFYMNLIDVFPLLDHDVVGGSKLREAMACGRAVVSVSGASGYQAEWIENNVNGILVSPDNFINEAAKACIELATNPKKRAAIGKEGRDYAEKKLSFDEKTALTERYFKNILAQKN